MGDPKGGLRGGHVAVVPPKIVQRQKKPALVGSMTHVHFDSDTKASVNALNGYIKHERVGVGALVEVDSDSDKVRSDNLLRQDYSSETEESDDEVFHASKGKAYPGSKPADDLNLRKPLMHSAKRKAKILKGAVLGELEMTVLGRKEDDEFGALVRKGWSWRKRFMCLTCFLGGNLLLGLTVCIIIYLTGHSSAVIRRLGFGSPRLIINKCPVVVSEYIQNATTDNQAAVYVAGPLQVIQRKGDKGWLVLVPYGSFCLSPEDCPDGGIVAYYSDTMQKAWDFSPKSPGDITSMKCGEDLNFDGVCDCAVTFERPASMEVFSGADGSAILYWYPIVAESERLKFFEPQWLPDQNKDGVAELFITSQRFNGKETELKFSLFKSVKKKMKVHFQEDEDMLLTNVSASFPAVLWPIGDSNGVISAIFDKIPGISYWKLWNFFVRFENRERIGKDRIFKGSLGKFADLDGDGVAEAILCDQNDFLVAVSWLSGSELWNFSLEGHKCLSNSVFSGRFAGREYDDVGVIFKSNSADSKDKMVFLHGTKGRPISIKHISVGSVENSVPLTASVKLSADNRAEDMVVFWAKDKKSIRLEVLAASWMNASVLLQTNKDFGSESEENREYFLLLNQRYTGAFYANEGLVEYFFATNDFVMENKNWQIMLHKLAIKCICDKPKCIKSDFADSQPLSSYRSHTYDGCSLRK